MKGWSLTTFSESYAINADAEEHCLLIPGWSVSSDIFEWILPGLAQYFVVHCADYKGWSQVESLDNLVDQLAESLDQPVWLIGWSMGGNIAIELAYRYPEKVSGLCLVATSPSFVQREHWPLGMAVDTFELFKMGVEQDPAKTLKRFDALQVRSDKYETDLLRSLKDYRKLHEVPESSDLYAGLQMLADFDQADKLDAIKLPMLWCFGEYDQLVNVFVAEEIRSRLPSVDVEVFIDCAHIPFLTQTDNFFRALLSLLNKRDHLLEKKRVADTFSKAAKSYDESAKLQKWVAGFLVNRIVENVDILLDAGCGTSFWTTRLADKANTVIGLDIAMGMLAYGQEKYDNIDGWLQADLEKLPIGHSCIGAIFSSLAVQWSDKPDLYLEEWYRVLKPGGKVFLATLGPKTLYELRESWGKADTYNHVNQFVSADELCHKISHSPFMLKELQVEQKIVRYQKMKDLLRDLKNIGAQTVMKSRVQGLMGKNRFAKMEDAYESYRDDAGYLPASYEVIFLTLEKPR